MKINRKNYESHFIDFIDGTLSNDEINELLDFLHNNTDLKSELQDLETIKIHPDNSEKYKHNHLLKSDLAQSDILTETCIRSIEKTLNPNDEKDFHNYLKTHSKASHTYRLYQATILTPDTLIVFEKKNALKKKRRIAPFWYSIAAVLIIGIVFWFFPQNQSDIQPVAHSIAINETPSVELNIAQLRSIMIPIRESKIREKKEDNLVVEKLHIQPEISKMHSHPAPNLTVTINNALEIIPSSQTSTQAFPTVNDLLTAEISKIDPHDEINKLGKIALNKLNMATNEKIEYSTDHKGRIKKIEFNSKLLAFSFPVKSNKQ